MAEKRAIFEEVTERSFSTPQGGLIERRTQGSRRAIRAWLILIFAMISAMVLVGGLTRLTDSGLSITQWKPVSGVIPPLGQAAWQHVFNLYKHSPQYKLENQGMTLAQFKFIYWWEWSHRLLGRTIGLVWAVGFFGFWAAGKIPSGWKGRLFLLGVLGGIQGAIGWWMVSSGLHGHMIAVASYRLATHLGIAFFILGLTGWFILQMSRSEAQLLQARRQGEKKLFGMSTGVLHMLFIQILLGALVAGIDAGRNYPTWPLMNGHLFPADAFMVPGGGATWRAFFENPGLVQFIHRSWGYLLVIFGLVTAFKGRRSAHAATRGAFTAMGVMLLIQMTLGIFTALYAAPLRVAIVHQAGAIVLWTLVLRARHTARYPIVGSIRKGTA
ncbi:heme A synthase [Solirhodobacter olei]|uniref:heme A synthase n=1 Tax=Solirhodobacter olei TaxID=2493082 RepID=UPI000FDCAB75|nr:heme A synthase [Solirhodobacter olei]